jgi:hypothetical protein
MDFIAIWCIRSLRHENYRIRRVHPEIHPSLKSLNTFSVAHFSVTQNVISNLRRCFLGQFLNPTRVTRLQCGQKLSRQRSKSLRVRMQLVCPSIWTRIGSS